MAVKVDMRQAYDRIEWVFIEETLKKLGLGFDAKLGAGRVPPPIKDQQSCFGTVVRSLNVMCYFS